MSGTKEGAIKTVATNKAKYGEDFYVNIGAIGGRKSKNGGFASAVVGDDGLTGRQRARTVGARGGRISRRGPNKVVGGNYSQYLAVPGTKAAINEGETDGK